MWPRGTDWDCWRGRGSILRVKEGFFLSEECCNSELITPEWGGGTRGALWLTMLLDTLESQSVAWQTDKRRSVAKVWREYKGGLTILTFCQQGSRVSDMISSPGLLHEAATLQAMKGAWTTVYMPSLGLVVLGWILEVRMQRYGRRVMISGCC